MKTDGRLGVGRVLLIIMGFAGSVEAATLSSPARSGDQFQFELQGDAYRDYVIQGSSNLVNWVSLATNVSPSATRRLNFTASNEFQFYRSAPLIQTNPLGKAVRLTGFLDLRGNNFVVDSFNSTNPIFSTGGQYDPMKSDDMAELSLDEGLTNSLEIGNVAIFGDITTGPDAPLQIGSYGSVGNKQWHDAMNVGIQPGKLSINLNPYFSDAQIPFVNGSSTPLYNIAVTNTVLSDGNATNYVVTTYDMVFDGGDYFVSTLMGKILIRGNSRIHVIDDINLTGSSDIIRIETNASLKLYVDAPNVRIGGNGIVNESNATNFIYYGLPTNTYLSIIGSTSVTGIFYAPQTRIAIGYGGNDVSDFIGAIVADSLVLNGHWHFHYDEALRDVLFPE